ncbi:MAG TPA: hypothetical protein VGO29_10780, partial [Solirubrobacteraceae bacterium]|nr:hypothetical protein [Solirubrobacteraceae bacterium]
MIAVHRIKRAVLIATAAAAMLVAAVCAPVVSAETTAPWWGLSTGARPTNLGASSGKDEVQRLRVKATEGDYALKLEFGTAKQEMEKQRFALVPFNASAAEIREAIEHPFNASPGAPSCAINPGEASCAVTVTEEASGEANTRLFKIVFASEVVALEGIPFTLDPGGEAVTTELQKGARSENQIIVYAENLGNVPTSGKVTLTDQLPAGLTPTSIGGHVGGTARFDQGPLNCELKTLTCTFEKNHEEGPGSLPPFELIEMRINVQVGPSASNGELNNATVSGGGAAGVTSAPPQPIAVGTPQRFGVEDYSLIPEQQGGLVDTQAGSHPFQLTSVITLNTQTPDQRHEPRTSALPKDISSELPAGLVGNAIPLTQCTDTQFEHAMQVGAGDQINECPAASAVGVATVTYAGAPAFLTTRPQPIFNMVPLPGEPVRFGFKVEGLIPVFLDTSVRTGSDYGVTVSSHNIIQAAWLLGTRLTFWGVPGDPAHDGQRGWKCLLGIEGSSGCPAANATSPPPFLSMPTSCAAPFESPIRADSWAASGKPSEVAEALTYHLPEALDGCNHLPFAPSIRVISDGSAASAPTGVNVDVHVPQDSVLNAEGLAESAAKDISVTLPDGMAINPSGGNGLQACPEDLVGFTGFATLHGQDTATFTPALPAPLQPGANFCPDASKVGTVKIKVPIIANPLEGSIYLASQNENPFGSLIAMYIVAEDPVSGVLVKLPGEVHLSPTGQITGTFHNSPQAPFEDAELHFFGGERAPLATPARCGAYTTNASLTPWSGNGPVGAASTFNITSGPNASACPGAALPFSPSLTGGTTNINAGSLSPLTTTIGREDGQQDTQSVQLHMPAGLSGLLSGVKLCPEQSANEGTCSTESLIGETTVSAGVGSDPVSVKGGKVYITEHYAGSPFGLS